MKCVRGTRFTMSQLASERSGFAYVALAFGLYYVISTWVLVTKVPEPVAKTEGQVWLGNRASSCCYFAVLFCRHALTQPEPFVLGFFWHRGLPHSYSSTKVNL